MRDPGPDGPISSTARRVGDEPPADATRPLPPRTVSESLRRSAWRALGAVIFIGILAAVVLFLWDRREKRQEAVQADALVTRLIAANIDQVPDLIDALDGHRARTDPELARIAADSGRPPRQRMRASLALEPVDADQLPYLLDYLLTAEPEEVRVICSRLQNRADQVIEPLWQTIRNRSAPQGEKLRAASALASFDREDERWKDAAAPVVGQLVQEHPLLLPQWVALLRPVGHHLREALAAIYRGPRPDAPERIIAASILAEFPADEPTFLAELIKDADPRQYAQLIGKFLPYRAEGVLIMVLELEKRPSPEDGDEARDRLARRQANAAVTLYRMRCFDPVWPLLRQTPDPRIRSFLIHSFSALGADPKPLARRWDEEPDVSSRRAILLSLGEFARDRLPFEARERLIVELIRAYRNDPDPGIHGAAGWLLRTWGADELRQSDGELRTRSARGSSFHVNGQGQTMVRVDDHGGPAGGSSGGDVRPCFAIATTETTVAQFRRFRPDHGAATPGSADRPVQAVSWFDAAAYCRWLSEQEGLPEDQMCYPPVAQIKSGMKLPRDYRSRTGYRLPTEWEWEQACRAGTVTSRFYGGADELLGKYAWYRWNAGRQPQPVARLKPNDLGLFDMLGNTLEWCHGLAEHPEPSGRDGPEVEIVHDYVLRAARGGAFTYPADGVRADERDVFPASTRWPCLGFRVARTVRPRS